MIERDEKKISKTEMQRRAKLSKKTASRWQDPESRKMMIEKQRKAGFRTYPQKHEQKETDRV